MWDPYTCANINKLEMFQRWAARYMSFVHRHCNKFSMTSMLESLIWRSLENRRMDMLLCIMYKTNRGLVAISKEERLIPPKRSTRHSHLRAFQTITKRMISFFPRTLRDWNTLSPGTGNTRSLQQNQGLSVST